MSTRSSPVMNEELSRSMYPIVEDSTISAHADYGAQTVPMRGLRGFCAIRTEHWWKKSTENLLQLRFSFITESLKRNVPVPPIGPSPQYND